MRPLARGYIHQVAFYFAIGICMMLIWQSHGSRAITCNIIYSISLIGLYGVSSLYHCHEWSRRNYLRIRSIDHAAIYGLIAGTATPICMLGLKGKLGFEFLVVVWATAVLGMFIAVFWRHGPKWIKAFFYVALGWLAVPFSAEIKSSLGVLNFQLLLAGGVLYTFGAMVYVLRRPDPFPRVFGYHEIFHLLVVIASGFHFAVIYSLSH